MNIRTSSTKIPVIVIFAPTASGKTALTRELFSPRGSHFVLNGEVVSADSQQVYRTMDIGTAKPDKDFCKEIPHHLIDILDPEEQFNVSDFVDAADKACEDIYNRGKIPVVCGGTGFYIRNFLYGVPPTPESDELVRNKLKKRIEIEGNEALYNELKSIDPESALKIHVNDSYRICRALEVFYISGKTRTSYQIEHKLRDKYNFLFIVLEPDREILYRRIRLRVEDMFSNGLAKEINTLKSKGYTKDTPGMKAIGYSEWFESDNLEEIRENIKQHSCKYAKKQYTYIRDIKEGITVSYSGTCEDITNNANIIKQSKISPPTI